MHVFPPQNVTGTKSGMSEQPEEDSETTELIALADQTSSRRQAGHAVGIGRFGW